MDPLRLTLLTPRGKAAIAVLCCSGPRRAEVVGELVRSISGKVLVLADLQVPRLCHLVLGAELIDEALVHDRTGQAMLELHVHGSEAVLRALESRYGTFTCNEPSAADRLMREALVVTQLELAIEQLAEPFEAFLARLQALPTSLALHGARAALARCTAAMAQAIPARVVLCGAQNAGKSTLMNRLVMHERVLTGPLPGLTRDAVEEVTTLAGYPYRIFDTAGEGPSVDELDRESQARAVVVRQGALRILVVDATRGASLGDVSLADANTLWVRTKLDLQHPAWPSEVAAVRLAPVLHLSCRDPNSAPGIRNAVGIALRDLRGLPPAGRVGGPAPLDAIQLATLSAFVAQVASG